MLKLRLLRAAACMHARPSGKAATQLVLPAMPQHPLRGAASQQRFTQQHEVQLTMSEVVFVPVCLFIAVGICRAEQQTKQLSLA